jgi:hypothetical protein
MEYILIGVLITFGSWVGTKIVDIIEPKETIEIREEHLQCVIVVEEEDEE